MKEKIKKLKKSNSMKIALVLCSILLFHFCSSAQSDAKRKIHRLQDTTRNKSGLYYGKSTEGHFSVLLPIPFNDFTITAEDVATYVIGGKSQEGIKFSVTEVVKKEKNKVTDFEAILKDFNEPSNIIADIKREPFNGNRSIRFSIVDKSSGAICKYIDTKSSLYILIIEFPVAYKKTVEENFTYFFSSLNITEVKESDRN